MLHLAGPEWEPIEAYYDCRYAVLRQPLGFERGAEVLNDCLLYTSDAADE